MTCPHCPMPLELCDGGEEYRCLRCGRRYVFDPVSGKILLESRPMSRHRAREQFEWGEMDAEFTPRTVQSALP